METIESQADSATEPQSGTPSARRLVIRVKIVPNEVAPAPAQRRLSKGALLLILGAVALVLSWVGIGMLRTDPPPAPPATEVARSSEPQPPAPANPVEAAVPEQPEAPPSPVNEVIPAAPRSALDTIRGTIRVSIRVTVDKEGTVLAATADEPGPSRYFARLATDAAKKWTFTPATSEEQRIMLVKFNFTRSGATARASSL